MSAAAARRRKQLAARKKASSNNGGNNNEDAVLKQLNTILDNEDMDEPMAYEALQLAQSQVRKRVHNSNNFIEACELAYTSSLKLLRRNKVSVASQLLMLFVQVLRETHTEESELWIKRIVELNVAHQDAIKYIRENNKEKKDDDDKNVNIEIKRLLKLQRDWLRRCVHWSSELGPVRYGQTSLQEILGQHCWELSLLLMNEESSSSSSSKKSSSSSSSDADEETYMDLKCDAIAHMTLAEKPLTIVNWLSTLRDPTKEEIKSGHACPPCDRDALFTRSLLFFVAIENLRDGNVLLRHYVNEIEKRDLVSLTKSYVNKTDDVAPSHVVFGSMLLRVCEKDTRTGPLYSWLLRSFKRELDMLHKPQIVHSYTTKIGKIYFNIQPPPDMLKMMENMMNMMGGGGGGGMGGPGINPAMMQAAMAQMQGMQ